MSEAVHPSGAWRIEFFVRHPSDDPEKGVPVVQFLESLPAKVVAEIEAVLDAVAKAPPPRYPGGGKWEAMRGEMAGIYEVRAQSAGANHRLFCLLERADSRLEGPSIVCLGGLTKPPRSAASPRDYAKIRRYAAEFRTHGRVRQE